MERQAGRRSAITPVRPLAPHFALGLVRLHTLQSVERVAGAHPCSRSAITHTVLGSRVERVYVVARRRAQGMWAEIITSRRAGGESPRSATGSRVSRSRLLERFWDF